MFEAFKFFDDDQDFAKKVFNAVNLLSISSGWISKFALSPFSPLSLSLSLSLVLFHLLIS